MKLVGKNLIERVLQDYPPTRHDDKLLQLMVWYMQGVPITQQFRDAFLRRSTLTPETIRRVRQKLQEQGKYLPAQEVVEARKKLAEETKSQIRQGTLL